MLNYKIVQANAISFFERKTLDGFDMSSWRIIRTMPEHLTPVDLVLLGKHTDEDISTLIRLGFGINSPLRAFAHHFHIDIRLIHSGKED
jgi:hypothetical protein